MLTYDLYIFEEYIKVPYFVLVDCFSDWSFLIFKENVQNIKRQCLLLILILFYILKNIFILKTYWHKELKTRDTCKVEFVSRQNWSNWKTKTPVNTFFYHLFYKSIAMQLKIVTKPKIIIKPNKIQGKTTKTNLIWFHSYLDNSYLSINFAPLFKK